MMLTIAAIVAAVTVPLTVITLAGLRFARQAEEDEVEADQEELRHAIELDKKAREDELRGYPHSALSFREAAERARKRAYGKLK